ncbi:hypothetical protein SLAV_20090 [Streptomyces lavendulae subsp. lavendulae]|uniref:Uncharacterized protein n=2 Tax=Streptomyces lavendulae TaxID=1914 RepID=A0A2K8PGH1_STRLA|nr:hypothetical protein SLAV_20090 [Streptomyces lavendulae subsp. lavendulae]QUQ55671.1 hypothetical protein SLLC_18195 [Streptomyces lavendulae subsp. lavendulae]
MPRSAVAVMRTSDVRGSVIREESVPPRIKRSTAMDGTQDKRQEPGKGTGREAQEHHRPGDPAQPRPGRQSREQEGKPGQKKGARRREDDLLREEDLHDEGL